MSTSSSTPSFRAQFLTEARAGFRTYKALADRALAQVNDDGFFATLDDESNSMAIVVKHMAGNMRSRWTDFLHSDGEKPDRHRDTEFVIVGDTRDSLEAAWEAGWHAVFSAVDPLTENDLDRTITIRGEPHTVLRAINRQLLHYSYHVGQLVFLARHAAGSQWTSLSVPRGQSTQFNAEMNTKFGERSEGRS